MEGEDGLSVLLRVLIFVSSKSVVIVLVVDIYKSRF